MITANVFYRKGKIAGFLVEGHSGYAPEGQDIVCAAVSTAVQSCVVGITEVLKIPVNLKIEEARLEFFLNDTNQKTAQEFMKTCELCIKNISEQYPDYVKFVERN